MLLKQAIGHAKKAGTMPKRYLKELRNVDGEYTIDKHYEQMYLKSEKVLMLLEQVKEKVSQGVIKDTIKIVDLAGPWFLTYHRGPRSMGTMLPKGY